MIFALTAALALLGGAQADAPSPTSRWSLQVEPARCVLERRNPADGSTLMIDTTPGSDDYRWAIAHAGIDASTSLVPGSLIFAPSQTRSKVFARRVNSSNNTPVMVMQGVLPAALDNLSGSSTVTLEAKNSKTVGVSVTGSAKAVAALRKCNADQLVEWGADPAQFLPGGTAPTAVGDRDAWISNGDLMTMAGMSQRSVINDDFRLLVATDGTVTECHATAGVTEAALEKSACAAVTKRRLFNPAKTASGTAVVGAATFRISLMRRPS